MSFVESVKTCFSKIVTFDGRARRSEYWWFEVCILIIDMLVTGLLNDQGVIAGVVGIIVFLAALSVTVRRLHDVGKSGWFYLINLIPFVGQIILLIFLIKDSEPGENKYGPNPKGM